MLYPGLTQKDGERMTRKTYLFTSESVSEGHPDKVCDRISDTVVDAYLGAMPEARVACETLATTNRVVIAGEVRGPAEITSDYLAHLARLAIKDIGYEQEGFHWETADVEVLLHSQSADIAVGVDAAGNKDEGAGDQGIMFGYACRETDELMPAPIYYAHRILRLMAEARKVIVVPGYGMAIAKAQTEVVKLSERLMARGKVVRYAIHPVAGRMPGHMNVLLAEAGVDYDMLIEMEMINPDFPNTDLVLVVGACDVVNPAAIEVEGTPISGMPVLMVHRSKQVVCCNFDDKPGYSGVDNPLYEKDNTLPSHIRNGNFTEIGSVLNENIHNKGRKESTLGLIKSMTGAPLSEKALIDHLERRYLSDKR